MLEYRYDADEEEYYLHHFDEMHNHLLVKDPRLYPQQKSMMLRPTFETPSFFVFETVKSGSLVEFVDLVTKFCR